MFSIMSHCFCSLRRRSRSISPGSRGSMRSPPYRSDFAEMDRRSDRGPNGHSGRPGPPPMYPPQSMRPDPRGERYSESPSPPRSPDYDNYSSPGRRGGGRRDG